MTTDRQKTPPMLKGQIVCLRPARQEDKSMIYRALAHSDLTDRLLGHPEADATPLLSWQAFCDDYGSHYFDDSDPMKGRCFILEVNDTPVGQINYNQIDLMKNRVELDIWMVSESRCGHGYGPDAIRTLCDHLSTRFNIKEFVMGPSASNARAIRAYEKAGFTPVALSDEAAQREYGPKDSADGIFMTKTIDHQKDNPCIER